MYPQPNNKLNRSRRNSSYSTAEEYSEMFRNLEIFSHKVFVAVCKFLCTCTATKKPYDNH